MPKRRLPPRRSSSSSSSPSTPTRRNADTKSLVTAQTFSSPEVGGYVRAVLLGVFVGGVVIFLFYPDISRLLQHWQNASAQSAVRLNQNRNQNQNRPVEGGQTKEAGFETRREEKVKQQGDDSQSGKPKSPRKTRSTSSKRRNRPRHHQPEPADGCGCPCSCQRPAQPPACGQPPPPPACGQPPPPPTCGQPTRPKKPKKNKAAKAKKPPKEDLMEDEEVVEEEDPVEVELMEIEEPVEYIDLKEEDEGEVPPSEPAAVGDEPGDAERGATTKEEPLVVTEGQPITFTPVSGGDENVIRIGGRPKAGDVHTTPDMKSLHQANSDPAATLSKQNFSAKTQTQDNIPKKGAEHDPDSLQPKQISPRKEKAPSQKSLKAAKDPPVQREKSHKAAKDPPVQREKSLKAVKDPPVQPEEDPEDEDLPEEVRNFLPSYLRTVTAKKIFADGRRIPPVELLPQKDTNSSVSFSRQLGTWMSGNWSYSTAFYPGESRFSSIFATRVQQAMGLDPSNGGKFQITSYPSGKAYKAHTDCVLDGQDQRDRVATVLVYLDDVTDGGETKFPELGIWVKPRKGRALVWNNMSPGGRCEPHSLHVASRVNSGSKYILIRWYYYKSFYSLGKRPPEPDLPPRAGGTPRVSCDDYDNGSCRWYDEWNNDHLVDYEYRKYTLI